MQRHAVAEERRAGTCAAEGGGGQRRETGSGGRAAAGVAHAAGGMGADGWATRWREREREGIRMA